MTTPDRVNFNEAAAAYLDAAKGWAEVSAALAGAHERAREVKHALDLLEAQVTLSPEVAAGRNAEERAAKLRLALAADGAWQRLRGEADSLSARAAVLSNEAVSARDALSLAKRIMDFETAWLRFLSREGGEQDG